MVKCFFRASLITGATTPGPELLWPFQGELRSRLGGRINYSELEWVVSKTGLQP